MLPASTAVGPPIPIGQDTLPPATAAPGSSAEPDATTAPATDPAADGASTTTAGSQAGGPTTPPTPVTSSASGPTSSPTTTDPGDEPLGPNAGTAFCTFEAEVEDAGDTAVDDAAFLTALAGLYQRMDQWIKDAPTNDLRAAATTMRDASKQSIDSQSVDPLDSDDATEALLNIRLYCADVG